MRKAKGAMCLVFSLALLSSLALSNGLNLNSLGSRAAAMGGALVGLADDFSTIFWNPAGMANMKTMTLGFYGTDIIPNGTYSLTVPIAGTVVDTETNAKHYLAGMLAFYYPLNEKLVLGLGVYTPSGLGAEWDGADFTAVSGGLPYEWMSKIGMVSIAPGAAYRINDMISVGATLNINYGMFDIKRHAGFAGPLSLGQYEESDTGWAVGGTLGVLVKPMDMLSFGATIRTATTVRLSGEAGISNLPLVAALAGIPGVPATSNVERDLTFPMWIAGGVAFRPIDKLTLTFDIQWTQWSKLESVKSDYENSLWQIFMAIGARDRINLHWRDATQIRVGAEYKLTEAIALRAGYYYDPAPAPDTTMNILLPSYDFNNFTVGLGYAIGGIQVDIGFEYLTGKERSVSYLDYLLDPAYADAQPGKYNMSIISPDISISYRF